MDVILEDRYDTYRRLLLTSTDPERKREASKHLRRVRPKLRYVLDAQSREEFLLEYLQFEAERYHAGEDDLEDIAADEVRSRSLCTCRDSGCPLKHGKLPVEVQDADSIERGAKEFRQGHTGDALVFDDAQNALDHLIGYIGEMLDVAIISLRNDTPIEEFDTDYGALPDDAANIPALAN